MQGETRDMFYKVSLVVNEKKKGGGSLTIGIEKHWIRQS